MPPLGSDPRETAPPREAPKKICPKSTPELVGIMMRFMEQLTSVRLYNYQRVFVARVVESVLENDGAIITALWSRQSGKTEALALLAVALVLLLPALAREFEDDPRLMPFTRGFRIGIFAPIDEQAKISYNRMREFLAKPAAEEVMRDQDIDVVVTTNRGDTLAFSNGSMIQARSASPDSQIEGKTFELVMCLEGSTQIETPHGMRPIRELVESGYTGKVRALDHHTGEVVWADVLARQDIAGGASYRLTFNDGHSTVATGDHLWWVDGLGYVETRELCRILRTGSLLLQTKETPDATDDCGHGFGRRHDSVGGERERQPATGDESQCEADGVRRVQGGASAVARARPEDHRAGQPREGEPVGEVVDRLHARALARVPTALPGGSEGDHARGGRDIHHGDDRVHVDGRREPGEWEQPAPLDARVQSVRDHAPSGVVRFSGVDSDPAPGPTDGGRRSAVPYPRVRGDERTDGAVHLSFDGVQVRNDTTCGLRHLRQELHPVPNDGQQPMLFVGVSEGAEKVVRRLVRCEEVAAPDRVYDLTTSTGNFFADGVLCHNCEESQKLGRAKVDKEIRPMLASTNGSMVKIGTAWESKGGFHTDIARNVELMKRGAKRSHFEFPYDRVIREKQEQFKLDKNPFHLRYEKFVQSEITRIGGTDSPEFKMNFRCLWQETQVTAVTEAMLEKGKLHEVETGIPRVGFQIAGLDLGKQNDRTVLTLGTVMYESPILNLVTGRDADADKQIYYRKQIHDWLELEGAFEGSSGQYQMIVSYLRMTQVKVLCIDSTGLGGDVITERLMDMLGESVQVVPFPFNSSSKSNLYKYYLQELQSGRLLFPAGPATRQDPRYLRFIEENLSLDKETRGALIAVSATEGSHDDYPDSAALMCWAERVAQDVTLPTMEVNSRGKSGGGAGPGFDSVKQDGSRYGRRGYLK